MHFLNGLMRSPVICFLKAGLDVQIGTDIYIALGLLAAVAVLLPAAVAVWWLWRRKEQLLAVLIGAATWFCSAIVLEGIPKAILFSTALPIGRALMGNVVLYAAVGALLAGIFEETGRLVAFKTILKKYTDRETGISHGIGHGGFEAMYILGIAGIQYLSYAMMIGSGRFQEILEQAEKSGMDVSALEAIPVQLGAWTMVTSLTLIAERVFSMLLHVGLSIMVFTAVRESRMVLYLGAVVLHALFDVPAALYQRGVLNLYVVEAMLGVYSVAFLLVVYKLLYQKKSGCDIKQDLLS